MLWLTDSIEAIRDFMELGGPVLRWKIMSRDIHDRWEARSERKSWNAHQIREGMISQFSMATNRSIPMIQTLVALCPLLGLMGTVTGMIKVFGVMASGSWQSPVRAMCGQWPRAYPRQQCRRWRVWWVHFPVCSLSHY
jgi:biopolymer transport protein ExbB